MTEKAKKYINKDAIIYKKQGGRYTIDDALEIFKIGNAQLLEDKYVSYTTKMKFVCKCGEIDSKKLCDFMKAPYCKACANTKRRKSKSTPFHLVKREFDMRGYHLITEEYINTFQDLEYICNCGEKLITNYERIRNGNIPFGCKCINRKKYTKEYLKDLLHENGLTYLEHQDDSYKYAIKFICSCGKTSEKTLSNLKKNWICNDCSHRSFIEKISGENNYQWNSNKTDEDRQDDRKYPEYKQWRNSVFERDNYTCQCCRKISGILNAHHKNGYHWCTEGRTDLENGVTLCNTCHSEFHNLYGNSYNTEFQYDEFISNKIHIT